MPHFKTSVSEPVVQYYASLPNSVDALYATFRHNLMPLWKKEIEIEAWGELCFDHAAARAVAYHMWNNKMASGWTFVSWRVAMSRPGGVDAKTHGLAPEDFSLAKYGPPAARP